LVDGAENVDVDVNARKHGTENDECVDTSDNELDDDDDASDAEMDTSFSAPLYSPISPSHYDQESYLDNVDWDVIGDQNLNGSDPNNTFISDSNHCDSDRTQMDMIVSTPTNGHIVPYEDQGAFLDNINWDVNGCQDNVLQTSADWKGFKLVGYNVDKNVKPSLQRFDNKTNSLHYFHYYAVLDRMDLSACCEVVPTDMIDLKDVHWLA